MGTLGFCVALYVESTTKVDLPVVLYSVVAGLLGLDVLAGLLNGWLLRRTETNPRHGGKE